MTKNTLPFEPTRSLMYIDVANEEYRVKLEHWLFQTHIPESISIFQPYVTKYAFYSALPVPSGGERFGTARMQLTEHYWLACPDNEQFFSHFKALAETMPKEMMKWQGFIPDEADLSAMHGNDQEQMRQGNDSPMGGLLKPLLFAFIPVWWEDDMKGAGRTITDGPNYRWQFVISFPDQAKDEGEQWLMQKLLPAFARCNETTRILSSKIIKEASSCMFDRLVEIWFEGPNEWKSAISKVCAAVGKPSWAQNDDFPYVPPYSGIQSIFVSDIPRSDNFTQYRGYITMR